MTLAFAVLALILAVLLAVAFLRLRALSAEAAAVRAKNTELDRSLALEQQKSARAAELERALSDQKDLEGRLAAAKTEAERQSAIDAEALRQERKQSEEKLALLADAREQMTREFKSLAADVMRSHGETFSRQNKEQIELILAPLRDRIGEFQSGLETAQRESSNERAILADQIRRLSEDSSNLTRALRGEAQAQGAWGEMILSSILERSGLREGEEYHAQQSHTTDEGDRLRSDVIVDLPGGQRIVIDSKVSLTAFQDYVNAESAAERAAHLKRHLASIRAHIKSLSGKQYHAAAGSPLDYVVLFMPIEGALAAALAEDPNLTTEAVAANVAIATPTTLMIALRTVANVWQVERRNRNAEMIAERAGRVYDKLAGFLEDMTLLSSRLNQARAACDEALSKLSTGRGNLVRQVEQLKQLGAKAGKSIPADFLDGNDADDAEASPQLELPGTRSDAANGSR